MVTPCKKPFSLPFKRDRIAELKAGVPAQAIADQFGISANTLQSWLSSAKRSAARAEQAKKEGWDLCR